MAYLLDTGILLRLIDAQDVLHTTVLDVVAHLGDQGEQLLIATQNVAEFCNVVTRPVSANGLGLLPTDAIQFLNRDIEPFCKVLFENDRVYEELKRLVEQYNVVGKQVHDARLVATMLTWQVDSILTLNDRHFRRFEPEGITVVTPADLASPPPAP
jgi:predicted nucleic acid-binding protein